MKICFTLLSVVALLSVGAKPASADLFRLFSNLNAGSSASGSTSTGLNFASSASGSTDGSTGASGNVATLGYNCPIRQFIAQVLGAINNSLSAALQPIRNSIRNLFASVARLTQQYQAVAFGNNNAGTGGASGSVSGGVSGGANGGVSGNTNSGVSGGINLGGTGSGGASGTTNGGLSAGLNLGATNTANGGSSAGISTNLDDTSSISAAVDSESDSDEDSLNGSSISVSI